MATIGRLIKALKRTCEKKLIQQKRDRKPMFKIPFKTISQHLPTSVYRKSLEIWY